jgi:hypothetical protein
LGTATRTAEGYRVELRHLPPSRPPANPNDPGVDDRSLSGSISIFFQKVVSQPPLVDLTAGLEYPLLAIAGITDDGSVAYNPNPDAVRARVAAARRILLYTHGIIGDTHTMAASSRSSSFSPNHSPLYDRYDLILTFDYEYRAGSIPEIAQQLGERLAAVGLEPGHGKTLHLIAHSTGGLVALWFVERAGGDQVVQHLVLIGTPSGGVPWGSTHDWATALLTFALNDMPMLKWPASRLRELSLALADGDMSLDQIAPGSEFLAALRGGSDPGIPYTIIAGNASITPAALEGGEQGRLARLLERLRGSFSQEAMHLLPRLAFFEQPNDIAVSLASISQIPTSIDPPPHFIAVVCDHLSYFSTEAGLRALADALPPAEEHAATHPAPPATEAVRFTLWAPGKTSVHLAGEFNGWDAQADPMTVDEAGLWGIEKQLAPGTYAYQFVIDGDTFINDPYARQVREAEQTHTLVQVGATPYEWDDAGFTIAPPGQIVIYELHVGDFSPEGTFAGIIPRLDHLAELGVNAIELMPIQEFPGSRSWGYNPAYFFAPESSYGTPDDFKRLVDAAHQKGIAVILDVVFNHTANDSPLNLLYPYDQNPYFGTDGNPWGFPDFNHSSDATKRLIKDIQDYWLTEFHVDGFRYDYVEGIRYDGINGMSFIARAAHQTKPHAYLIAETAAVVRDTEVDASWHWQFGQVLRAQLHESENQGNLEALVLVLTFGGDGYEHSAQPVNYLESHDEERIIHMALANSAIDQDGAVRKSILGAIMLFTAQGVPMLYHGQEFGARSPKTIDVTTHRWPGCAAPKRPSRATTSSRCWSITSASCWPTAAGPKAAARSWWL